MGFFAKLFGAKSRQPSPPAAAPTPELQGLITVYDAYGRELQITKQEWRDKILQANLEKARNDPDQLYQLLASALQDGFVQDILPLARHLHEIDPNPSRAATLLGVVYLQLDQLDAAERTFRDYIRRHGEEAYLLANLAKVFSKRGNEAKADATLWRSLQLDPNQHNAVDWFWAKARQRGGAEAGGEALRKIAGIAGSWRARLWLARLALERSDLEGAVKLYDEALAAAGRPAPIDLLTQMSGDLGNHGHLVELLRRTTPLFDVAGHGLLVGNNLIKANIELGRLDHARALVDRLYALKRPDYQQTLAFWETEIAKARTASDSSTIPTPLSMTMLVFQGPIWLSASLPAASLFPPKDSDAVVACFLGASVEKGETGDPRVQLADATGRLSRAVTIFLCEQLHLLTTANGQVMQPWIPPGGMVICGAPWDTETAVDQAKACHPPGDYVVMTHIIATSEPFTLTVRLLRCIDGSLLDSSSFRLDPAEPEPAFTQLSAWLLAAMGRHAGVEPTAPTWLYRVPDGAAFANYQLRLEQALAVRAATVDGTGRDFLNGEREIVSGMLHLCLIEPANIATRILLLETLRRLKEIYPQIVDEFADRLQRFEQEHPVPEPAGDVLHQMLSAVTTA